MINTLLLTGGLGYIGTHTIVQLLKVHKLKLVIIDNFNNCRKDIVDRLKQILTLEDWQLIQIYDEDILNPEAIQKVFQEQSNMGTPIQGVIHFAALKNATESIQKPIRYYEVNVQGSLNIFKAMEKFQQCKYLIFSSSAAVYGDQDQCTEEYECRPVSPYGQSKLAVQMLVKSLSRIHKDWRIISLRYFNPGGCHESGLIGDWPSNYPGNLFPSIQELIIGKRRILKVFGSDYDTVDGSGVRDYLHVSDLARGHVKALQKLFTMKNENNYEVYNLGSGNGYSVLEVLKCFEKGLGKQLSYEIVDRRPGDMPKLIARCDKANKELDWKVQRTLQEMCDSCIRFTMNTLLKNMEE